MNKKITCLKCGWIGDKTLLIKIKANFLEFDYYETEALVCPKCESIAWESDN